MKSDNHSTEKSVIFSADVLRILRNLPDENRLSVTKAIVASLLFGDKIETFPNQFDGIAFTMIVDSIRRASCR